MFSVEAAKVIVISCLIWIIFHALQLEQLTNVTVDQKVLVLLSQIHASSVI